VQAIRLSSVHSFVYPFWLLHSLEEAVHPKITAANCHSTLTDNAMKSGRENFRMEVANVNELSVEIRKGNTYFTVKPTTLSLTGIFVEPRAGDWVSFAKGDEVEVIMEFEDKKLTNPAVVQRCESGGYALSFGTSASAKNADPDPQIRQIVMELQRRWLEKHKR
jgi:hypothetical protein